ncbi:hypothetical protein HPB49_024936 [Dermacentor silvarum]|uniref:Uncharacterized protein n=1 Tax=Dermacentor silvarum TaxID=543639 RepID=A0ACB8CNG3_DERSI|nr:hypothetical protein HPB49_024936 [Dermacentor silvarum]
MSQASRLPIQCPLSNYLPDSGRNEDNERLVDWHWAATAVWPERLFRGTLAGPRMRPEKPELSWPTRAGLRLMSDRKWTRRVFRYTSLTNGQ